MSAEPVDHTPPTPHGTGEADVIDINTRVTQPASKGRWKDMTSRPHGPDGADSRQQLADHLEMTFNEDHLTLSNDDTKAAYTITLGIVRGMLRGAHAKGVVDETQLETLDAMIEGMLSAPRLV